MNVAAKPAPRSDEQYRHECEVRYVAALPSDARRFEFLTLVRKKRGEEAYTKLRDDTWALLRAGRDAAKEGIKRAATANSAWIAMMLPHLRVFCEQHSHFPVEMFRARADLEMLPQPESPNAWGAFTQAAIRDGMIEDTHRVMNATSVATHGHRVPIYQSRVFMEVVA